MALFSRRNNLVPQAAPDKPGLNMYPKTIPIREALRVQFLEPTSGKIYAPDYLEQLNVI